MKIRVWTAFASNNSGSYTIVGRFPTAERAAEVARALTPLLAAQTRWREAGEARPSPLERMAIDEQLDWEGTDNEWPEYAGDNTPRVLAVGEQVLLHHDYTVSLPRVFGAFFYARGGAVDACIDHAHHPLVAVFEVWWPWDKETQARVPELEALLANTLRAPDGLASVAKGGTPPVIRLRSDWMHPFQIAAVFEDLVAGVAAVRATIERHGGGSRLRILEALDENNPLAPWRALPES